MGRGRPRGSKNKPGHSAGGKRNGSGQRKKVQLLGRRPVAQKSAAQVKRSQLSPPARPSKSTTPDIPSGEASDSEPLPLQTRRAKPIVTVPLHPIFSKKTAVSNNAQCSSQSISAAEGPSLPHIPIIIPDTSNSQTATPIPRDLVNSIQSATENSNSDDCSSKANTDDPEPEVAPAPEGAVKLFLETTRHSVEAQMNLHGQPDCYRVNKSFWILPIDDVLLPADFVFACPSCDEKKIGHNGWNSNPTARRVVDLDSCYYLLTKRLKCRGCKKTCTFTTHRSAIDKNVMTLIRSGIAHGLTLLAWERILRELHVRNRDLAEQAYLHELKHTTSELPQPLQVFSSFSDKFGFAGFSPSRWYINQLYIDYMGYIKPHQDQAMAALPAKLVRWDRSYKVIKYIARLDGVRLFGSLWTMINQNEQIRQLLFTLTDHLHHIERPLQDVVRSLHEHGHEPILGLCL
ncbi:hypothetical protein FB451DRAFT_1486114 [Mycena latifolia]|nr:hypothetical protein FB451DRAFT_1486114 [Mycena latifolia]